MRHTPVLLHKIVQIIQEYVAPDETVVDCNFGDGGHSEEIIRAYKEHVVLVGFDLDPHALLRGRTNISKSFPRYKELCLIEANFRNISRELSDRQKVPVKAVLYDLGLSSFELDESKRGFSFRFDEPLQMTFGDPSTYAFTAYDIVNSWEEEHIADVLYGYGEERYSRKIARAIVEERNARSVLGKSIATTSELVEIIKKSVPSSYRFGKIHPATKTFQALRIAVNDELRSLEESLSGVLDVLDTQGVVLVLTYHSLEDRIVKRCFKTWVESGKGELLHKKPLIPSLEEIQNNPRARSAKLRIFKKN